MEQERDRTNDNKTNKRMGGPGTSAGLNIQLVF
jgi:hypothetical protein